MRGLEGFQPGVRDRLGLAVPCRALKEGVFWRRLTIDPDWCFGKQGPLYLVACAVNGSVYRKQARGHTSGHCRAHPHTGLQGLQSRPEGSAASF